MSAAVCPIDERDYERNLDVVRGLLGEERFAAAFVAGRELDLEAATAEAVTARDAADAAAMATKGGALAVFGLTPHEREVLRFLARHATNREIADALSISPRTVMHHVSRILAKVGVANRRDAADWPANHEIA